MLDSPRPTRTAAAAAAAAAAARSVHDLTDVSPLITREIENIVEIRHLQAVRTWYTAAVGTCEFALVSRADVMRRYHTISYHVLLCIIHTVVELAGAIYCCTCLRTWYSLLGQSTVVHANQLESTATAVYQQNYERVRARLLYRRREREIVGLPAASCCFRFRSHVCRSAVPGTYHSVLK